jgi:hypothetical protein
MDLAPSVQEAFLSDYYYLFHLATVRFYLLLKVMDPSTLHFTYNLHSAKLVEGLPNDMSLSSGVALNNQP